VYEELDPAWDEAILHVLREYHPNAVSLQTIYSEMKKYRKLREEDLELTRWGEPRYQHVVRAALHNLLEGGYVKRICRGMYTLTK
jgi:Mn-dependent DtxR family transcriptional regulator